MISNTNKSNIRNGFLSLATIRDILLIIFLIIVSWKVINSDFKINLQDFEFSDLLSMLLAFFAIWLSAAFYFKATETSNMFYDNIHKFTKDVSVILGRIEAGFGEKLRHIDDGYVGLRDKLDKIPFDINHAKEKVQQEQKELEQFEDAKKAIIEEFAQKAKLEQSEKDDLLKKLSANDESLSATKNELQALKNEIKIAEISRDSGISDVGYIYNNLDIEFYKRKYKHFPQKLIIELFNNGKDSIHPFVRAGMEAEGIIDSSENLTKKGVEFVNQLLSI